MRGKCENKIRDKNGRIVKYEIRLENGEIKVIESDELKEEIKNRRLYVDNLVLSKDNKLLNKKEAVPDKQIILKALKEDYDKIKLAEDIQKRGLDLRDYNNLKSYLIALEKEGRVIIDSYNLIKYFKRFGLTTEYNKKYNVENIVIL